MDMMMGWRHSGFNVFCGPRIQPGDEEAIENLARYIICASFSKERMTYIAEESKVLYQSKDGKKENMFDALEWLVAMCSHVPEMSGEKIVPLFLSELPYIVVPVVLQRIQYPAMNRKSPTSLLGCDYT